MEKSYSQSYKEAGVDVTAGYKAVELMKAHVARTATKGVMDSIGGFGGLFRPDLTGIKDPVLVSGTDGVGTKLKLAFLMDRHDTVGIDCVAMCVNDIVCVGAQPMFFLDYIACGKNYPEKIAQIVKGVADGCVGSETALIGGETAEMPGFYPVDEYDLAGFAVGIADREKMIDSKNVREGDVIIGLASSGVHSNGFSLVRKIFDIDNREVLDTYYESLGRTLGETLLEPTRLYVKPVMGLLKEVDVHGCAHITGGGFYENMPRAFGKELNAVVHKGTWPVLPVFDLIRETGNIPERDMYNTFNMGIGMMLFVAREDAEKAVQMLKESGCPAYVIGEITAGDHSVIIEEN